MDARPQRPIRVFRAAGDENVAPLPCTKQTIHQRHKSTGTLSSMLNVGGLRAAAKRTAFGDVSNTRNLQSIQDDSALPKQKTFDFVKPQVPIEKPATLLRPAQRPLNPVASKANLHAPSAAPVDVVPVPLARSSIADLRQAPLPFNKQPVAKRAPAIYKDVEVEVVKDEYYSARPVTAPAPKTFDSQAHDIVKEILEKDARETAPVVESYSSLEEASRTTSYEEYYFDAVDNMDQNEIEIVKKEVAPVSLAGEAASAVNAISRALSQPPVQSDPAEPQYEEPESDEDFATAYSFRSRGGDNTTGGATMIMAPHVTNRARQELAEAKLIVDGSRTQEEIEDEAWDTSMVAEYGDEIFSYMRELEARMLPNPHYMDNQAEIQWSMRSVLMDWLIQVHHRFALLPETLFLCVNYIDRFLSCKVVSLGKLQLVGATAIFVAAKYEEINCPSVQEIAYMVDGGYTTDEILKAERYMLSMLQFELGWPGPMSFLRRISKADEYDLETRTLAKYFLEVTIMDERFVGSVPSYVAAGAHALARFMLKKGDWTAHHAYYSGYTWTQLKPLVMMMMECCRNPQKHHCAVFEKYSDRRYKRASIFVQDQMDAGFMLPHMQPAYIRPSLLTYPDFIDSRLSYEIQEPRKQVPCLKA